MITAATCSVARQEAPDEIRDAGDQAACQENASRRQPHGSGHNPGNCYEDAHKTRNQQGHGNPGRQPHRERLAALGEFHPCSVDFDQVRVGRFLVLVRTLKGLHPQLEIHLLSPLSKLKLSPRYVRGSYTGKILIEAYSEGGLDADIAARTCLYISSVAATALDGDD